MSRKATGLRAWIVQRVTAVILAVFAVVAVAYFVASPPGSAEVWRATVASPLVSTAILLTVVALLWHAWVGIRDVLIDYVHLFSARLTLLSLFGLGFVACGLWALQVVVRVQVIG
jgi:succinate dehydrogenase / fumarate reductase, membrane anchor subunit